MAGRTFGADKARRTTAAGFSLFAAVLLVLVSIYVAIGAIEAGLAVTLAILAIVFIAAAVHTGWYMPDRVTIVDTGVVLRARKREIFIPWSELRSVEIHFEPVGLIWRSSTGRQVWTPARFDGLSMMLNEIRHRSPWTAILP